MANDITLAIDDEFASVCWKPTQEEIDQLDASLVDEGCREAIRYWQQDTKPPEECPIVDGHTRYARCKQLGIAFSITGMDFPSRSAVLHWIARNQLGRRNVSEIQKHRLRLILVNSLEAEKKRIIEANPDIPVDDLPIPPNITFAAATEAGVSTRTIYRDKRIGRSVRELEKRSPILGESAAFGNIALADARKLMKAPDHVLRQLEGVPEERMRASVKAALSTIIEEDRLPPPGVHPTVFIRELQTLEVVFGQFRRANSSALKACGGIRAEWVLAHHESIRLKLDAIYEDIRAWQKEAEKRGIRPIKKARTDT
jgi:hypothetical protein